MDERNWYVAVQGQQNGPYTAAEVVGGIRNGSFDRESHVFSQGMEGWAPIESRPEFAAVLTPAAASSPAAPAFPAAQTHAAPAGGVGSGAHEIDYEILGGDMQFVEITLDPGEACVAEAGAFMFMEPGIEMQTIFGDGSAEAQGGGVMGKLLSAGKRVLTGESLFMTVFDNRGAGRSRVAFAAPYPGAIVPLDLRQHSGRIIAQKDSFLCAAKGVAIGIAFQRKLGAGFFGGEGFILQKLEGDGLAFVHACGTIVERDLQAGESLRVDTGCLVAMQSQVGYDIQMVSGIKSAFFGGEGLFYARLTGPGKVWLQSLPFSRLADRIYKAAPKLGNKSKGEGSALGGLGGILMGD